MDKRFAAILVAIVIGLGGVFWLTGKKSGSSSSSSSKASASLSNHLLGGNAKGVTLVEYGDFQCPYCGEYYPLVKQVSEKYKTDIAIQFRNFPLTSIHKNAFAAARAAEAADKQGKYWEMHDQLYETQDKNGKSGWVASSNPLDEYFVGYAKTLGLNTDKFKQDFASSAVNDTINADYDAGQKLNITGTPSFFLQGKKLDPAPTDIDGFSKAIDQAIKDAKK